MKIIDAEVIQLRIPFTDGSSGVGLMPTQWTHLDMALVKLTADDGTVGWGDRFAYSCRRATAAVLEDMVLPLVVGAEIDDVPAFNRVLQQRLHLHGRYGITIFAISAVDIALWDIAAKQAGKPLSALLSGRSAHGHTSLRQSGALWRYRPDRRVHEGCRGEGLPHREAARDRARLHQRRREGRRHR